MYHQPAMSFIFNKLEIPGLLLIEPKVFTDERGYFMEKFKHSEFIAQGIPDFVQDNFSFSRQGVVRALHYQTGPHAQGKLVTVLKGKIWDVAVDVRKESPYYGRWLGVELSDENNLSFYIPPGFAHGFSVLSSEARFLYKCTAEYDLACERGIRWNDTTLNIDWKVANPIVCERDKNLPAFS